MDIDPGSRGAVLGDRFRVAGTLRRTGVIDAVDLEAPAADAACRVVAVPGDAARVDAWEDAWRAAQDAARLPRLLEIVPADDGGHWAVLTASRAAGGPPAGAARAAGEIGAALAGAGLDAGDVTAAMLAADGDGRLILDGVVWLGGGLSAREAGRRVAELLPPDAPAAPPRPRRRTSRRRLAIPLAIAVAVAAAGGVLVMPDRSGGTAPLAPAADPAPDVLLGAATAIAVPAPVVHRRRARPRPRVVAAPPPPPPPADDAPALPAAAAAVPQLPVADPAPVVPATGAG